MFQKQILEIPLSHEMERRHLSAVVGIMVFLVTALLLLSINIGGSFFAWQNTMIHKLTIKIPTKHVVIESPLSSHVDKNDSEIEKKPSSETPFVNSNDDVISHQDQSIQKALTTEEIYQKVIEVLKNTPSVLKFEKVKNDDLASFVKKWIPKGEALDPSDLPIALDVDFGIGKTFNMDSFLNSLSEIHPKIHVDYNERLQSTLHILGNALKVFSFLLILIVVSCLILLMTLVTQSSLKAHSSIIDILRLMGAKNGYIINLYQCQAFKSVLTGSLIGSTIALTLIFISKYFIDYFGFTFITFQVMNISTLEVFICVPLLTALLAFCSARIVVAKELKRLSNVF